MVKVTFSRIPFQQQASISVKALQLLSELSDESTLSSKKTVRD